MSSTPTPDALEPTEPTAKERLGWMAKNSRILVISLIVILVAALVATFSFSLFNSSSANPGNMATSGIMTQSNSKDGQAILTAENLLPGEDADGTVSITNVGDADGHFTLTASDLTNTAGPNATADTVPFSSVLNLVIMDGTTEVYNDLLSNLTSVDLGTWAGNDEHNFTFTITFDAAADNELQGAKTTLNLTWDAEQSTS